MAVEINSGSTGDPSAKSSKPDELLCVALSMDLALSYLHLKLNVGEAGRFGYVLLFCRSDIDPVLLLGRLR